MISLDIEPREKMNNDAYVCRLFKEEKKSNKPVEMDRIKEN